jgi:L-alanine-DL-glutamate epimerase-like enolase superfamily enzyme
VRITAIEQFHADGGWRTLSFLRISTDDGVVGWSEYNEAGWNRGLSAVIRALGGSIIGADPLAAARLGDGLRARTAMAAGGLNDQAIAAIENACFDITGKAWGVPVSSLFGGPQRDRVRAYWSHCGSFRVARADYFAEVLETRPITAVHDFAGLGEEALERGYTAAKLNPVLFGGDAPRLINPGFEPGWQLGGTPARRIAVDVRAQLEAFRSAVGADFDVMLDLNFSCKPGDVVTVAEAISPFSPAWLEADVPDVQALADVRRRSPVPIASLETVHGARSYRLYFDASAVDVPIVDVVWNGLLTSIRIAAVADTHLLNVAPHNFYGPLATLMSLHFCASVPNNRITEVEGDDVPWRDELLLAPPVLQDGDLLVPTAPGWGSDVDLDAVRRHPARPPS